MYPQVRSSGIFLYLRSLLFKNFTFISDTET
ncbi:hypothetical protein SAMN04490207_0081 [Pseudomonas gessardii]|nr:hypothetical protein SAMN04490207_0081 [Pseudomonas gessardii]